MPWWNVAGSLLSSAGSIYSANKAWQHQKEYAQNAHQWEVEDLKKAGLNPILSAGGSGAPMTSAPMASIENPFANFSASQIAKKQAQADVDNKKSETKVNNETADRLAVQTGLERDLYKYRVEEANWNAKTAHQNYINATKMPAVYDSQVNQNNSAASLADSSNQRQRAEQPLWQVAGEVANTAAGAVRDGIDWIKEKWKEGYKRSNDTSKNKRSGFIAHLDRGGTVANYKS